MSYQHGHETRYASENGLIGLNGVNSPCALPRTVSSLVLEEYTPHLHHSDQSAVDLREDFRGSSRYDRGSPTFVLSDSLWGTTAE